MEREIAMLESEINCLKREKEIMEQEYQRRRDQLLQQSRQVPTGERAAELIRQMVELNSKWRQDNDRMSSKIYCATAALNTKKRQQ